MGSTHALFICGFTRFLCALFVALRALLRAIATACFAGLPVLISVLMFELIVLGEDPFFRGILSDLLTEGSERS